MPSTAQTNSAQTNSAQTKMAPQSTPVSTTQSLIQKALRNLRVESGPRPRTPEQKAQEAAAYDRINDLIQAGTEALHNQNFVAAEADYRQLAQETTLGPFPYYGLGEALADQGKITEAIAAYKVGVYWPLNWQPTHIAAIDSKPNFRGCCGQSDAVGWLKCALLLSQTGQAEEARTIYRGTFPLASDTNHPGFIPSFDIGIPSPVEFQAAVHLALGLFAYDYPENAMSEFDQALRLQPDAALTNYYYGYGWRHLDVKSALRAADASPAKLALQKAAALGNDDIKKAAGEALQGL